MVKFLDATSLAPGAFNASFPGGSAETKVRRVLKGPSGARVDLNVRAAHPFHDPWSNARVETAGVRSIGGLGAALDVARKSRAQHYSRRPCGRYDEVLQAVRNNLVHLSGTALDTTLPPYDSLKNGGGFTLRDFLDNEGLVQDFVFAISRFVTDQYVELRSSGVLYT